MAARAFAYHKNGKEEQPGGILRLRSIQARANSARFAPSGYCGNNGILAEVLRSEPDYEIYKRRKPECSCRPKGARRGGRSRKGEEIRGELAALHFP